MDPQLTAQFEKHVQIGRGLPPQSADHMLIAYAYYKQAVEGDNQNQRPLHSDVIRTFKHDAWVRLKGMSREEAMRGYIGHIQMLVSLSRDEGRLD